MCLKCESASMHFQPGEGPSRGLLRDCTTSPINRLSALVPSRHLFTRRHTRLLCSQVARQQPGSISHNNSRVTGINVRYSCDFNLTACINQQLDLVVCNVWWELQRYTGEGLYISARWNRFEPVRSWHHSSYWLMGSNGLERLDVIGWRIWTP